MNSFVVQLTEIVSAHAGLAYLTIFFAALLEAVPVFGSVIPGSTVILALSALVAGGELQFVPLYLAAISGAIIGDGTAYWIGHRMQREILQVWPLSRYPGVIAQSETFFHRHGTLAVFFARFVPPIRAFVPVTAGALGMSPRRFYSVNVVAVIVWASAHILPGVAAASVLERYGAAIRHYWLPIVIVVALVAGGLTWLVRRRRGINVPAKSTTAIARGN